jgi:hypothetical protein
MTKLRPNTNKEIFNLTQISTLYQDNFARSPQLDVFSNYLGEQWIDPLTPSFIRFLKSDFKYATHEFVASEPLTTVSYRYYDTTSLWYLIVYVNGFMHPDEIPSGTLLKIPYKSDIEYLLTETRPSKSGTIQIV